MDDLLAPKETSDNTQTPTFQETPPPVEENNGVDEESEQSDTFEDMRKHDQPRQVAPRTKRPETVLTGTFKEPESSTDTSQSFPQSSITASDTVTTPRASIGQRFALVFVNSPASSLIKSRISLEFDDFPTITIGRSPESVVVVPDQEVSRKHAQLNLQGDHVILKDLNSSNGTFLYNGTEFQRVSDGVEVKPNSIIKFGTGTIVRLVSE
jgi:pSer/pThr/pTyr-binding forkhead associated (FHA) protein